MIFLKVIENAQLEVSASYELVRRKEKSLGLFVAYLDLNSIIVCN